MSAPDLDLTDLAAAVADGGTPDWPTLESAAADERTRALVGRLRSIADIARAHGEVTASSSDGEDAASSHAADLDPPFTWGPLRVVERIGSGRFGDVYRAFDPHLDRDVALKLLRHRPRHPLAGDSTLGLDDEDAALVIEEGRLAARVRHPNVVTIYGAQRIASRTGIWMELVRGHTLEAELADTGPFDAARLAEAGTELARALGAVHEAGLVHRDVKATNVMRDLRGRIVLGDFGTGRDVDDSESSRQGLAGTPVYLAPEIFEGQPATVRSDLYSLGVLLFHLATGQYPVGGRTLVQIGQGHRRGERAPLRSLRADLPAALTQVINRAIDPDPGRRFESAAAMGRALDAALARSWSRWKVARAVAFAALTMASVTLAVIYGSRAGGQESGGPPASTAPSRATGVVLEQLDPAIAARFTIRAPAADGRHATCSVKGLGNLAICDLTDGSAREVRPGDGVRRALTSPDGRSIAYHWIDDPDGPNARWSLRIIDIDGRNDREVIPPGPGFDVLRWAGDGHGILIRQRDRAAPSFSQLSYVPASGGLVREVIRTAEPGDLSPDLARVVVTRRQEASANRDLVVIDVASGVETVLAPHPADDVAPIWTVDGNAVVFQSDRLGVRGLFLARVDDGGLSGARLLQQVGRVTAEPLGFAADGTLFLTLTPPRHDTFMASLDPERMALGTPERLAPRSLDITAGSDWSPDGAAVAYLAQSMSGLGEVNGRLVVANRETGAQREIPLVGQVNRRSRVQWLGDGKRVAVSYYTGSTGVVDLIDTEADGTRRVLEDRGSNIDVAAHDDAIFYMWVTTPAPPSRSNPRRIYRLDLRTMATSVVYDASKLGPLASDTFAVSPDGRDLLIVALRPGARGSILRIVRPDGTMVDRHVIDMPCGSAAVAWSPDGSQVIAACMTRPDLPVRVWIMPAESGESTAVDVESEAIWNLSIRPDGRAVTFTAGNPIPMFYTLRGIR